MARRSSLTRLIMGDEPSAIERLTPDRYPGYLRRTVAGWLIVLGVTAYAAVALVAGGDLDDFHALPVTAFVTAFMLTGAFVLTRKPAQVPVLMSYFVLAIAPCVGLVVWLAGARFEALVAVVPLWVCGCFVLLRKRTAFIATVFALVSYAVALAAGDGYSRPVAHVVYLGGILLGGVTLFVSFAHELQLVAERLESTVEEQGGEISRLGRLRRFLSPQIADTVLSAGAEDLLSIHRRQIAVIFVDLRGFTAFSAVAEPEDVIDMLTDFYAAVGSILKRLEATVGGFAGDGVMAYFNDPVPCEDPAGRALETATSLRLPMSDLRDRWTRRGFNIGYGVGIAYGYATLGTIGFEERSDYTPIGSVVNLASRLCDEAGNGEALLDGRAYEAVREHVDAAPAQLDLKGFNGPVTAYRVSIA